MFKSYMDESGIHDGAPICVVAGYIGGVAEWEQFELDWKAALDEYNVCQFHSKEFYGSRDPKYSDWTHDKRDAFLNRLFDAISQRDVCLAGAAVDVPLFHSMNEHERRYVTGGIYKGRWVKPGAPSKPYFLPFQHCINIGGHRTPPGETLHPVMSEQRQYQMNALDLYRRTRELPLPFKDRLAERMVFRSPKSVVELQAADLAAYHTYQYAKLRQEGGLAGVTGGYMRLLERMCDKHDVVLFNREGLALLLDGMTGTLAKLRTSFLTPDARRRTHRAR